MSCGVSWYVCQGCKKRVDDGDVRWSDYDGQEEMEDGDYPWHEMCLGHPPHPTRIEGSNH